MGNSCDIDWVLASWRQRGFFPHVQRLRETCRQLAGRGSAVLGLEHGYDPGRLDHALTRDAADFFAAQPEAPLEAFVDGPLAARFGPGLARDVWVWLAPYEQQATTIYTLTGWIRSLVVGRSMHRPPGLDAVLPPAREANARALAGARAALLATSYEPWAKLAGAVMRLAEQQVLLDALASPAGAELDAALVALGTATEDNRAVTTARIQSARQGLREQLTGLPRFWLEADNEKTTGRGDADGGCPPSAAEGAM